ncbi:MAG: hypothetical protein KIT86_16290 [Hydrogenophaga sp.]|uniref:hypothetical protein n=1 Tax=Hydrogenophaga sp. TaxID=1904254 RepID=UPI00260DA9BB|nr:hypothetical protein [Hydrogenophaga sp.]MCW5671217.1 hypothetical protein [Hydrogenophaga sp.]
MSQPPAAAPPRPSGAPQRDPSNPVSRTPRAPGSTPGREADDHLELPHERDQSTDSTAQAPDPEMQQAHQDLKDGQVDTDMRATPGLDAGQRAGYVPGAGGESPTQKAPPSSPTAPRKDPRR